MGTVCFSSFFSVSDPLCVFVCPQGFVSYQLPLSRLSWAAVFKDIEENKERLGITDYSISQITLEQV